MGYDAGKQVKGRKINALVDSEGLPMRVIVHSATIQNRRPAKEFESLAETLATFVTLASIQLALRRLAREVVNKRLSWRAGPIGGGDCCCGLGEGTFASIHGNEQDAPKADELHRNSARSTRRRSPPPTAPGCVFQRLSRSRSAISIPSACCCASSAARAQEPALAKAGDRHAMLSPPLLEVLRVWWREGRRRNLLLPGVCSRSRHSARPTASLPPISPLDHHARIPPPCRAGR